MFWLFSKLPRVTARLLHSNPPRGDVSLPLPMPKAACSQFEGLQVQKHRNRHTPQARTRTRIGPAHPQDQRRESEPEKGSQRERIGERIGEGIEGKNQQREGQRIGGGSRIRTAVLPGDRETPKRAAKEKTRRTLSFLLYHSLPIRPCTPFRIRVIAQEPFPYRQIHNRNKGFVRPHKSPERNHA